VRRSMLISLALITMLQITVLAQSAQNANASLIVTGRVVDVDGHPIDKVHVCAVLMLAHEGGSQPPCTSTDADGNFSIALQQAGRYGLIATKIHEGYLEPIRDSPDSVTRKMTMVKVEEQKTFEPVTIRLRKSGKVAGQVVDAETGLPVENISVDMCYEDPLKRCTGVERKYGEGKFQVFAPGKPFTVKISSPGYEDWFANDGSKEQAQTLRVAADDTITLRVSLRPIKQNK